MLRKAGNTETEFLRLLCRLALCSPKNIQMALLTAGGATVLRMARCGTKRQDGEEGRAEAVMRAVSKHYVSARRTAEAMMAMPLTRYELHVPCPMSPCPLYRRPRVWRSEIDMWRLAYVAQAQRRS